MATLGKAYVVIQAKMDDLERGLNTARGKVSSASKTMASSVASIGRAVTNVGAIFTAVFAGTAAAAIHSIIDTASDLNEIKSKVEAVFGQDTYRTIEIWSRNASTAIGLSQAAALDAVGTMGNMFTQLGSSSDQAASLSTKMVVLAGDIASFHNVAGGANEVLLAMQSAFRGEYDALQRYIPTINAASVQQEALALSGKTSAKELTFLEKAIAAVNIIMESAGAATGDFTRTSGELAGQQRVLSAQLSDLKASLGDALLPAYLDIVTQTNRWVQANKDWVGTGFQVSVSALAISLRELDAAAEKLMTPLTQIVGSFIQGANAIGDFFNVIGQVTGGIRGFDGELKTTRNDAQVYVGTINDVRYAHEQLNETVRDTGPTIDTSLSTMERYAQEGAALGRDMWLSFAEESESATVRSNAALEEIRIEELNREITAMGQDMWLSFAEESEEAMQRSNRAILDNMDLMAQYAREGSALGRDMWVAFSEGSEEAANRENQAIRDMQLIEYLEDSRTVSSEMWNEMIVSSDEATGEISDNFRQMILDGDNFFNGMRLGWHDLLEDQYTWGKLGYDIVESFTDNSQKAMSDNLFDWITGKTVTMEDVWEDMWKGLLRDVIKYVAKIVAEWATVELLRGASTVIDLFSARTGAFNVPEDMLMWVHKGEMVVPADTAGEIRNVAGSDVNISPFSPSFDTEAGTRFATDFAHSIVGRYVQASIAGTALAAGNYITAEQLTNALTSVDFAGLSIRNSFVDALKSSLGLTGGWSKAGDVLGRFGAVFGGFGPVANIFGLAGSFIADAVGDLANLRENENMRDALEDMYGYVGGRVRYSDYLRAWGIGPYADIGYAPDIIVDDLGNVSYTNPYGPNMEYYQPSPSEQRGSDSNISDWDSSTPQYSKGGFVNRLLVPSGDDGIAGLKFKERVLSEDDNNNIVNLLIEIRDDARKSRRGQITEIGSVDVDQWMTKRIKNQQDEKMGYKFVQSSPISAGM